MESYFQDVYIDSLRIWGKSIRYDLWNDVISDTKPPPQVPHNKQSNLVWERSIERWIYSKWVKIIRQTDVENDSAYYLTWKTKERIWRDWSNVMKIVSVIHILIWSNIVSK